MYCNYKNTLILLFVCAFASGTSSAFDQWQINEVFSSSDGRVQYVELYTSESGQGGWEGLTLFSRNQDDGGATGPGRSLVLDTALTGDTAGRNVLLATQRFVERTGLPPDYYIPESFLPLDGGILYLGSVDSLEIVRED